MIIKQGEQLKKYIKEKVNENWRNRFFVESVKQFWDSSMDCVLGISGLRGMGKTTGLLQSLPDADNSLYICAQKVRSVCIDSADDVLDAIDKYLCKNIIIDEYTWIKDREKLDESLYAYIQNGHRIAITGTESMTLELLNYGKLAHRVHMLHCNYFGYEEYLHLYNIEQPDSKTLDNYLTNGGVFEEYAINSFDTMKSYIKEGIIDSLVSYLKNVDEDKATAIVYNILYYAVCPEPAGRSHLLIPSEPMDSFRFFNAIGINPETTYEKLDFSRAVDILKKTGVIIEVENVDGTNANKHRYYIVNPALNYQLFKTVYEREEPSNMLGEVFEAACVANFSNCISQNDKLYFLKGSKLTGKEYEIDFIIADKNCSPVNSKYAYYFECKHKSDIGLDRGISIESPEIEKYFPRAYDTGRYVLYRGSEESYAFFDEQHFIFAPLNSRLPQRYYDFDKQAEELKAKGLIYPKTPNNPFYAEYMEKKTKKPCGDECGQEELVLPWEPEKEEPDR